MTLFTTGGVPNQLQSSYWEEIVSSEFVLARLAFAARSGLNARLQSRDLELLKIYEVGADQLTTLVRDALHFQRDANAFYFLGIVLEGSALLKQVGRASILETGDVGLYKSSEPFLLQFKSSHKMLVVRVPEYEIHARLAGLGLLSGLVLRAQHSATNSLVDFVATSARMDTTAASVRARASLAGAVFDLLIDAVLAARLDRPDIGEYRIEEAKRVAIANAANTDFSVSMWADQLGISQRYLRLLFEQEGNSPSQYLRQNRLGLAAQKLRDPKFSDISILDIATGSGFGDGAYFSRSFRNAFGITPTKFRKSGE